MGSQFRYAGVFAIVLLAAFAGVGCRSDSGPKATPSASSTQPAATTTVPTGTPTADPVDVAAVRPAIEAIESGDVARVKALISLSSYPCTLKPQGAGSPPACPDGSPEGTLVQVFPSAGCEGYFLFPAELDQALSGQLGTVYGAFRRPSSKGPYEAPYAIVSNVAPLPGSNVSNPGALWGADASGKIVSFSSQCGANAREIADQLLQGGAAWVVTPTTVGIPVVDAAINAVLADDASALKVQFAYFKAICSQNPSGGIPQPPKCLSGEPDGTLVDVLLAVPGEGLYFRPEAADRELAGWLGAGVKVYSVKDLGDVTDILGVPRYQVVFVDPNNTGNSLTISGKGVVGLWFDQSRNPAQQAQLFSGTYLVPPPK
jgi:hypothetical protein